MTPTIPRFTRRRVPYVPPTAEELAGLELIYEDGEPMELNSHRQNMNLLIEIVEHRFRERSDFSCSGNMFLYFSPDQVRNRDYRGPDFFFVWNTNRQPNRDSWVLWEENGRTPDVVIELASPTTINVDRGVKKDIYERVLQTPNYFVYDSDARVLEGWLLTDDGYEPMVPNERGWLWSDQLQLWLGEWEGRACGYERTWLRWFDENGQLVPTPAEFEKLRADAAEAELARLRPLIGSAKVNGTTNGTPPEGGNTP